MTIEAKIFIDGEAGTTGLGIRERLKSVPGIELVSLTGDRRKDAAARRGAMADVQLVVLCLPDEAAKESVALVDSLGAEGPKVLDASTAYRVTPGWAYGFPEMSPGHAQTIAGARRVSNPGCYPTGAIALLRPLVAVGLMAADHPVTVNAVSGYSGGGKVMIEAHERDGRPAFELYGLGLGHKHVAEMMLYSGLARRPLFVPAVGHFRQGMLVSIPLHLDTLPGKPRASDLRVALADHFAGCAFVTVQDAGADGKLDPEALNNTDRLELRVFANEDARHAVLVARLDNLGKGASGAAVQNIRLMLGL